MGKWALKQNTIGVGNIAIGAYAMEDNTTGSGNLRVLGTKRSATIPQATTIPASGASALFGNTTGKFNTAFGQDALFSMTSGSWNTAVGWTAFAATILPVFTIPPSVAGSQENATGTHTTPLLESKA